ncbi:GNAT family N-acetyltransferase [Sphingomonas sp. AX6]|uniref:GNAT family N-acetyltransferase n=1 Tax=Sphingomonas sp. AX6 TaxID=2653171 RepID=UPI0012F18349|nr:N-acetyltransferase [Sphingomonas sp. AX6]VXC99163.1 GNAT family N-acetyltransferase [Sphingomonas sp. AX6]
MHPDFVPLDTIDPTTVEALLDRAFGADRHLRTAYRIREGTQPIRELSFAATDADAILLGTIQCWPVELRAGDSSVPMIMVGPVAVDPHWQQAGRGQALMRHMLAHVAASPIEGADALMLIGDRDYYGRFFGFTAERTEKWTLPGPFDRDRLLARGAQVPALAGEVAPRFVRSDLPTPAPMP